MGLLLSASWLLFAGYAAWELSQLGRGAARGSVDDLLASLLLVGVALAALRAARLHAADARIGRGWRLVAAAWLVSAGGVLVWMGGRFRHAALLDGAGWILYDLYYPLLIFGFWNFFEMPERGAGRARLALDGLITTAVIGTLAWYFVFRFDEANRQLLPFLRTLGVLFPGEMAVVFGASAVLQRPARAGGAVPLSLLAIGSFTAAIADFVYERDALVFSPWSGRTGDVVLALGATLVASAGLTAHNASPPDIRSRGIQALSRGVTLLPYVAVSVLLGLTVFEFFVGGLGSQVVSGLLLGDAAVFVLVCARLVVAQREFAREVAARLAQDALFRSLVQGSADAILLLSKTRAVRYASPALGRMLGVSERDLTGRKIDEFIELSQRDGLGARLAAPAERSVEQWRIGRDGTWIDVEAAMTDLTLDPLVDGIVVNLRDIGERLRLESQLRQAQNLEVVGRLSSSIAHDFNNLLGVILGSLQLARTAGAAASAMELRTAEAAAERGAALARQLLALSRPRSPASGVLDLGRAVQATERTLRAVLPSSIDVQTESAREGFWVRIDEVQLERILLNLALNARDAMPEGGRLSIDVDSPDSSAEPTDASTDPTVEWARITVRDTGGGMSNETAARAFEPFFSTKPMGLGAGLGLSTVAGIVSEANGRVSLDSRLKEGTTVSVLLPRSSAAEVPLIAEASDSIRTGSGRVLLVEDEPSLRRIVARFLSDAGYTVVEAADGDEAFAAFEAGGEAFDLLLTDVVMPKLGGSQLAISLRRKVPELPVIFMSGHTEEISTELGRGDRTLVKPFRRDALLDLVSRSLRDARSKAPAMASS